MNRRSFFSTVSAGVLASTQSIPASAQAPAAPPKPRMPQPHPPRNLKVGHTGITWPRGQNGQADPAIKDIGSLGYWGFETFERTLESYEAQGGIAKVLEAHNLPLVSGYCTIDMVDPGKRKEEIAKLAAWSKLIRKNGGKVAVLGPNSRRQYSGSDGKFDFASHKSNIVATLNDAGKAAMDAGIVAVLHPHTGTVVETLEEVYSALESVDPKYVKFGPDVGQVVKGGAPPSAVTKLVKDFREQIHHVHLKDFSGGTYYLGYCPLGFGVVEIPAILDLLEGKEMAGMILVELDGGFRNPMTPLQAAAISKEYLKFQGITFRV
ncbi:MAG: sugar phosphate isomerase/epimerase family protein [bacterium]|jgi:inosose dehydratase